MARLHPMMVASMLLVAATTLTVHASVGWNQCSGVFPVAPSAFTPFQVPGAVSICREGFIAISYDVSMINPSYAAYYITPADVADTIPGREDFYADPDLKTLGITQPSTSCKAFNSTYNKGHLAPSHILSHTSPSKHATYTMANVSPQQYYFNQHPWLAQENAIFEWILNNKPLYIITGILFKNRSKASRSWDNVAVPDYFFKAWCDVSTGESAAIIAENENDAAGVNIFRPVADVHQMIGGSIFPASKCNVDAVNEGYWWSNSEVGGRKHGRRNVHKHFRLNNHDEENNNGHHMTGALNGQARRAIRELQNQQRRRRHH